MIQSNFIGIFCVLIFEIIVCYTPAIISVDDLLGQVRGGANPQDILTAARSLLVPSNHPNMFLSIGVDRLSLKTLRNTTWLASLRETIKLKGEMALMPKV